MSSTTLIDEIIWYKDIGQRVKLARNEAGYTQQELANECDLKRTSITNIEKGLQKTSVYTLYKLSCILNKDLHDLLPSIETTSVINVDGVRTNVTPKSEKLIRNLLDD